METMSLENSATRAVIILLEVLALSSFANATVAARSRYV